MVWENTAGDVLNHQQMKTLTRIIMIARQDKNLMRRLCRPAACLLVACAYTDRNIETQKLLPHLQIYVYIL